MKKSESIFNRKGKSPGYQIQNKDEATEVYIYDEIGSPGSWWGVDPEQFAKDLVAIDGDVVIRINSPGGSVWGGMSMYNTIKDFKGGSTTVIIDGLAASAASYIALAGDRVQINQGAMIMIHEAWACMCGNAGDLRKEADLLDKIDEQIAGFYARQTGKDLEEIQDAMTEETWFTADEALEWGLVDEVLEKEKPAENLFDLSVFNNVPDALDKSKDRETRQPKDFEKALRDAGMSRREAKAVLSDGLKAIETLDTFPQPEEPEPDPDNTRQRQMEKDRMHRKIQLSKFNIERKLS